MKFKRSDSWSRREFLGSLAMTGAAAALGWYPELAHAAKEPPPETTTLRLRKGNPACHVPIYVAEPFLREEGFKDIQYVFVNGPDVVKRYADGEIDIGAEFSVQAISYLAQGSYPIRIISGLHPGCYALIGSERVRAVRDLKGKTVWAGAVKNAGPHIFFSSILAYVGLDPRTDVEYVWVKKDEAIRLFQEKKIDAFMSFPPGAHELLHKGLGHMLVDTNVDKPWSQYFCCMVAGHERFVSRNPVATRRALRAILKAIDLVSRDAKLATNTLVEGKVIKPADYQYTLPELTHIPYGRWREYNPEDTIRFYALRMRDIGMVQFTPTQVIEEYTDWRFINGLKKDFAITAW